MESLIDLQKYLIRTIADGSLLYNEGKKKDCFDVYLSATIYASECMQEKGFKSLMGALLENAADEAISFGEAGNYDDGAWVLRHCFDVILDLEQENQQESPVDVVQFVQPAGRSSSSDHDDHKLESWQDQALDNATGEEKAELLVDIYTVLKGSIQPSRYGNATEWHLNCFPGTLVVEGIVNMGFNSTQNMANYLLGASLLISVIDEADRTFADDNRHLYRFPTTSELEQRLDQLQRKVFFKDTPEAIYVKALQNILEVQAPLEVEVLENNSASSLTLDHPIELEPKEQHSTLSTKSIYPIKVSKISSSEQEKGIQLAKLASRVEAMVDIKDRKYHFKTYPSCFVGIEAVKAFAEECRRDCLFRREYGQDRRNATALINELLHAGLIHHVTGEHEFEDKRLFYSFTTVNELQTILDGYDDIPDAGPELVRYTALEKRLQQLSERLNHSGSVL